MLTFLLVLSALVLGVVTILGNVLDNIP